MKQIDKHILNMPVLRKDEGTYMSKMRLEQSSALDPQYYIGDEWLAFDQKNILASAWQVIAPASLVQNTGDMITREIGVIPVVITRNQTNELKGFLNICQHRAGPVATCDKAGAKNFRCAYHGWTYDLDGQLKIAPEMREAESFDKSKIRLSPIDVKEWFGIIFARIPSGDGDDLAFQDIFDSIEKLVGPDMLSGMKHHTAIRYHVASNWKIYADNYLEGYHLPYVHPGLTELVEYPDYTTELDKWWSVQRSPVEANDETGPYGSGEAFYFFLHPNTMLNIMPGRIQTNRIIAVTPTTCEVEFDFYYAGTEAEKRAAEDLRFSDIVQEEDRTICEHVQKALASGAYTPGRLSPKREAGVWHWQNILRDIYQAAQ
jgi:choline monooxygenase